MIGGEGECRCDWGVTRVRRLRTRDANAIAYSTTPFPAVPIVAHRIAERERTKWPRRIELKQYRDPFLRTRILVQPIGGTE